MTDALAPFVVWGAVIVYSLLVLWAACGHVANRLGREARRK